MTKAERAHLVAVQALHCIICRKAGLESPAEVHHVTEAGRRLGHMMHTLGLCPRHHRGKVGIHGMGRKAFEREYGTQKDLLAETQRLLGAANGHMEQRSPLD